MEIVEACDLTRYVHSAAQVVGLEHAVWAGEGLGAAHRDP